MTDRERIADILASWHERRAMGVDVDADELAAHMHRVLCAAGPPPRARAARPPRSLSARDLEPDRGARRPTRAEVHRGGGASPRA